MKSSVVILLVGFSVASCAACPDGAVFEETRYCLVDGFMPWYNATVACSRIGGTLAVPDSPDEQTFLYDFAVSKLGRSNSIWIDCFTNSHHADGTPCEYSQFQSDADGSNFPGSPASCAQMYLYSGAWIAASCDSVFYPVCELPVLEDPTEMVRPSMFCLEFGADGRLRR